MRGNFLQRLAAMRNCRSLSFSLSLSVRVCAVNEPKQTNLYSEPSRCALSLYKSEIDAIALHANITTAHAHYRN